MYNCQLTVYILVNIVTADSCRAPDPSIGHHHCHGLIVHVADNVVPDLHQMFQSIEGDVVLQESTEVRNWLIHDNPAMRFVQR